MFGGEVRDLRNGGIKKKGGELMQQATVDPTIAWTVWAILIIGTFLMTVIGTWLIARGWVK